MRCHETNKIKTKIMRAIEFTSKIQENKILIPRRMQSKLIAERDKNIRVLIFLEDSEIYDEKAYRQITKNQFLKGYAETDSIYDL